MTQPLAALEHAILNSPVPTATLLIGAPGSGKSTWVKQAAFETVAVVGTDLIIDALAAEQGCTYSEMYRRVVFRDIQKLMFVQMRNAVAIDGSIIVDRTNMNRKARHKVLCKLPSHYRKFAAVFTCDPVELDRRLTTRAEQTGKFIDHAVAQDMLNRYEEPTTDEFDEIFL